MNATGVLAQLITKNVSDTSKSVLRSFHTIIGSPTLNTKDNKDFMKARSQRVGLPAIRNIRFGDKLISRFEHCSTRKNFIVTEEKRDTVSKLELGIETRLTLKITTLSFPRRNLEFRSFLQCSSKRTARAARKTMSLVSSSKLGGETVENTRQRNDGSVVLRLF